MQTTIKGKINTLHTNTGSLQSLSQYADKLATMTLYHFCPQAEREPFDGDQTEWIAKEYLRHLNNLMGNK